MSGTTTTGGSRLPLVGQSRGALWASLAPGPVATRPALMPRPEAHAHGLLVGGPCRAPAVEGVAAHGVGAWGPQDQPGAQGRSTCLSIHPVHIPGGRPGAARSPSHHPCSHQPGSLPLLTHARQGCLPWPPGCHDEVQGLWWAERADAASQALGI